MTESKTQETKSAGKLSGIILGSRIETLLELRNTEHNLTILLPYRYGAFKNDFDAYIKRWQQQDTTNGTLIVYQETESAYRGTSGVPGHTRVSVTRDYRWTIHTNENSEQIQKESDLYKNLAKIYPNQDLRLTTSCYQAKFESAIWKNPGEAVKERYHIDAAKKDILDNLPQLAKEAANYEFAPTTPTLTT